MWCSVECGKLGLRCSLRGRRSKWKGKGIWVRDRSRGRSEERAVREISISRYMMMSLIIASWTFTKKNQYSQHFCAAVSLVPFIYVMRPNVTCKGTSEEYVKQKKDGLRLCNAEKDLPKVNSIVVFLMHSKCSSL